MDERKILEIAVKAADAKRAEDIVVLNMKGISLVADYLVMYQGKSNRQEQAITREIKEKVEEQKYSIKRMEGFEEARWALVDIGDIIVHVFHKDERGYYNLERLWGDAPFENIQSV